MQEREEKEVLLIPNIKNDRVGRFTWGITQPAGVLVFSCKIKKREEISFIHKDSQGYAVVRRGTQGYAGGTQGVRRGYAGGTQGHAEVRRGTQGVRRITQSHAESRRVTQSHAESRRVT